MMRLIQNIIFIAIFLKILPELKAQDLYSVSPINIDTKEYVEESAVYYKDGIVFVSNRSQSALRKITDQNGEPLDDLFYSRQKDNKKFTVPDLFSKNLKGRFHEGAMCFDNAGTTVYFTRVEENSHTAIYSATFDGKDWTKITLLSFNLTNYSFHHPCLSADGKRLFFSSNRPGGQGGHDIWVSTMGRGGWTSPKNLGPMVNSDSAELYPFYSKDDKLYFTSNRKGSLGGMDIYWTKEINGQWLPPKQLPAPFNTKFNDYAYVSDSVNRRGFISSDRGRSKDIFSFVNNFPVFRDPQPIKKNTYKYRFKENSIVTDSSTFLYEWDFGDSTKIKGRILDVIHVFPKPGDYLVTLNVIDSLTGDIYMNQAANVVQVRDEIQPVITSPDTVYAKEPVSFQSDKSYLPDYKNAIYFWDFGDGTLEDGAATNHEFYYPGTYKVLLGALDKNKNENSGFMNVYKIITVIEKTSKK